ncbi:hypothetical protein [Rhizobium leguminosarum]|uniref:hypothetical protein n=1 Tax=Rhizobium leguminosarum TaxID=384 RepID=UPI001C90CA15|nr:hypothetical protein [Rhizobium leguminosarum]MBY2948812.1 hypothetical protein [Rhizobium leguminosarum]
MTTIGKASNLADTLDVTMVRKPGCKRCLHPRGRNEVEDGKAVAGGASLAGPKAGAGRDGRSLGGRF